jgi:hypothetical protein
MKTMATTEAVSSPPEENEHWSQQWRQTTSCAGQNQGRTGKNELQTYEAGRKSRKPPHRSWALNHMGNPRLRNKMNSTLNETRTDPFMITIKMVPPYYKIAGSGKNYPAKPGF